MKIKSALVTGGLGFIGHHLVNTLIDDGTKVYVVDNEAGFQNEGFDYSFRRNNKASYFPIDITNKGQSGTLEEVCKQVDYVFHLAALPRVQYSLEYPLVTTMANVLGTVAVLEAAKNQGVKRVVLASSSSVYGESDKLPLQEDATLDPMSPYALQKNHSEDWCRMFSDRYGLETVCLRFFNVYGPGADPEGAYALVIAKFLEYKRQNKKLPITGDGNQTRDFTWVGDIVDGMIAAVFSSDVGHGEAINLGGGRQISVNEVAKIIDWPIEYVPARLEPRHTLASIEKAEHLLMGWRPKVSFEEGMKILMESNQS